MLASVYGEGSKKCLKGKHSALVNRMTLMEAIQDITEEQNWRHRVA